MRPGRVLRIARWEVVSGAGGVDRRAIGLGLAALVGIAALVPLVAVAGTAPETGIYRVGVDGSSPLYRPVADDDRFAIARPSPATFEAGRLDLLIDGTTVRVGETPASRAAGAALREAVERYNDRLMRHEADPAAAFPVAVRLTYVERDGLVLRRRPATGDGDAAGPRADGAGDAVTTTGTTGRESRTASGRSIGTGLPVLGSSEALLGETSGTPSDISPPFPFVSLVLAFAFVVPMNFVIQAYASSLLHERTNRRGELLLVSPVSRGEIIAGKTLPYLGAMVAIAGITAVAIGAGPLSLVAIVPVALLFLASAFLGAMLARSHKELTFVLVTVSVAVTTYVFVPAIFTQVHPIAAISPLTVVVRELEGAAVPVGAIAFGTVPVLTAAAVLYSLGAGLYCEEDLFAQLPLPEKALDALAAPIDGPRSAAIMSLFSIPFVFLAELLLVSMAFVLPVEVGLPVLLVLIATVEEVAKSVHVYAGFRRDRYPLRLRSVVAVGTLSGVGFFLGEKAFALAQLVGLGRLDVGRAAFELGAGIGGYPPGLVLLGLLIAPLALHVATAAISALGASRDEPGWYTIALAGSILVHAAYNLWVVSSLG